MTDKLLDDNKLRDGFTALFLALRGRDQRIDKELADLRQRVDDLRNRIEILEVRQAGDDRRIP